MDNKLCWLTFIYQIYFSFFKEIRSTLHPKSMYLSRIQQFIIMKRKCHLRGHHIFSLAMSGCMKREDSNAENNATVYFRKQKNPKIIQRVMTHTWAKNWWSTQKHPSVKSLADSGCGDHHWCSTQWDEEKRDRGSRARGQRKTPRLDVLSTTTEKVRNTDTQHSHKDNTKSTDKGQTQQGI